MGTLLLSSAVILFILGFADVGLALASLALLASAVAFESRREAPILTLSSRRLWRGDLSTTAFTLALSLLYQFIYCVPPECRGRPALSHVYCNGRLCPSRGQGKR